MEPQMGRKSSAGNSGIYWAFSKPPSPLLSVALHCALEGFYDGESGSLCWASRLQCISELHYLCSQYALLSPTSNASRSEREADWKAWDSRSMRKLYLYHVYVNDIWKDG